MGFADVLKDGLNKLSKDLKEKEKLKNAIMYAKVYSESDVHPSCAIGMTEDAKTLIFHKDYKVEATYNIAEDIKTFIVRANDYKKTFHSIDLVLNDGRIIKGIYLMQEVKKSALINDIEEKVKVKYSYMAQFAKALANIPGLGDEEMTFLSFLIDVAGLKD